MAFYRALVAIETDATRYYGPSASRPALLRAGDAEQMLQHVAADLRALLPGIAECSLISVGALYDQTQILRPGYPVFGALEAAATEPEPAAFRAALVSMGARDGAMPEAALQPETDIPLGMLQLLPLVVHGPDAAVEALGQAMEYRFLEEGQLSAHAANWLQSAFGIGLTHARLMTLTDLNAMLRLQLEHFGFLPLWELLDAALSQRQEALAVDAGGGPSWEWRDGAAHARFETFDYWANRGGGANLDPARMALAGGYGDWTRELRRFVTTLRAHAVPMRFHAAGSGEVQEDSYLCEPSPVEPAPGDAAVTHHSFGDLGTIAVTAVMPEGIHNFYPLRPRGLNEIQARLRTLSQDGFSVAWPGTILHDGQSRRLRPDSAAVAQA